MSRHATTPLYTLGDETHTLYEWGKRLGIRRTTLRTRLNKGVPLAIVLTGANACYTCHAVIPYHKSLCVSCLNPQSSVFRQRGGLPSRAFRVPSPQVAHVSVNQVAHCGTWHPVPMIPHTLPCCGTVLALEGGIHAHTLE